MRINLFFIIRSVLALWQILDRDACRPPIDCDVIKEVVGCTSAKRCCELDNADWLHVQNIRVIDQLLRLAEDRPARMPEAELEEHAIRIPYNLLQDPYVESFNTFYTVLGDHRADDQGGYHMRRSERHHKVKNKFPEHLGKRVVITDCRDTRPWREAIGTGLWLDHLPIQNAYEHGPLPHSTIYLLDDDISEIKYRKMIFFICPTTGSLWRKLH